MKYSVYVIALSTPLMFGASLPAARSPMGPHAAGTTDVAPVNFIDRLLQGGAAHRAKAPSHRPKRPLAKRRIDASTPKSPPNIPIPQPRPTTAKTGSMPTPALRPAETPPDTKDATHDGAPAQNAPDGQDATPQPMTDPVIPRSKDQNDSVSGQGSPQKQEESQPAVIHEDPGALKQCLLELKTFGTIFASNPPIDEGNGCRIEQPIKVDDILPGLALGGAVMRCNTALRLARWLKTTVQPAIEVAKPGRKITGIVPGTTYACRLRNDASSGPISEHAYGNAFDVSALTLDNGETIDMKPRADDHTFEGGFQAAIAAGACLYFTTVLAPGSDASHETHMHLDIKDRENGYRICDFQ